MDLYTLTDTFLADEPVDEFVSAIWTERYSAAGDVQLVTDDTLENRNLLAEGKFLALSGTKEVMQLETQSAEKNLLTVTGRTLPAFLNTRYAWFKNPAVAPGVDERIVDYTDATKKPGEFLADVIDKMVINPVTIPGGVGTIGEANLDWEKEIIPNLELGPVDTSGVVERLTMPIGPLYDGLEQLAQQVNVGISLYLDFADPDAGYVLKFTTYKGKDRTSDQSVNELVRLVPEMDGISDLKELNSIALYRNVAYVYYKGIITKHLAEPSLPEPEGFDRRVLIVNPTEEPVGRKVEYQSFQRYGPSMYTTYVVGPAEITAFREQNAKDALANANYVRTVDGETSPNSDYIFGVHYGLGDTIELEGLTGTIAKARVTEYIRSQDKAGEKNYPTISVVS